MTIEEKQKQLQEFKDSLKGLTKEELEAKEKDIMKEIDEANVKATDATFKLPTKGRKDVLASIRYFLNKQSVEWRYVLGMKQLVEALPDTLTEIKFPLLDTVLNMLGSFKYEGIDEWTKIMAVNDYLKPLQEQYSEIRELAFDVAERHSAIMDQLELFKKVGADDAKAGEKKSE